MIQLFLINVFAAGVYIGVSVGLVVIFALTVAVVVIAIDIKRKRCESQRNSIFAGIEMQLSLHSQTNPRINDNTYVHMVSTRSSRNPQPQREPSAPEMTTVETENPSEAIESNGRAYYNVPPTQHTDAATTSDDAQNDGHIYYNLPPTGDNNTGPIPEYAVVQKPRRGPAAAVESPDETDHDRLQAGDLNANELQNPSPGETIVTENDVYQ